MPIAGYPFPVLVVETAPRQAALSSIMVVETATSVAPGGGSLVRVMMLA